MDITGKLDTQDDQQYVIVTVEALTKYVLIHYVTDKSPHSTLAAINSTVHLFGTPIQITEDGGREFLGELPCFCERFSNV